MLANSYYVILFHTSSRSEVFIGVDMVMCHALISIKEIHQAKTLSMFQSILLSPGQSISIGECPSNSPFLTNDGAEAPKVPRLIVVNEWRDTRTFSNLKSTHCTLLILLIINIVTNKSLCIVSKVQREQ